MAYNDIFSPYEGGSQKKNINSSQIQGSQYHDVFAPYEPRVQALQPKPQTTQVSATPVGTVQPPKQPQFTNTLPNFIPETKKFFDYLGTNASKLIADAGNALDAFFKNPQQKVQETKAQAVQTGQGIVEGVKQGIKTNVQEYTQYAQGLQKPVVQNPQNKLDELKNALATNPQGQGVRMVGDILTGFLGESGAASERAGGQNFEGNPEAKFTPQNYGQKLGPALHDFIKAIVEIEMSGVNTQLAVGTKSLNATIKSSTKLADAEAAIGSFAERKTAALANLFKANKLTFEDMVEASAGRGTPEKLAAYQEAVRTGAVKDLLAAQKALNVAPNTKVADFLTGVKNKLSSILKTKKEEIKLLSDKIVEVSPTEARDIVIGSNLENTTAGKAIVKASVEAEQAGTTIKIGVVDGTAKSTKDVVVADTPGGVTIAIQKVPAVINLPENMPQAIPKNIEPSVVQLVNQKTGEKAFKVIPQGELSQFSQAIDTSGGHVVTIGDQTVHLTAKTPDQMLAQDFKYQGVAKFDEIPKPTTATKEPTKITPPPLNQGGGTEKTLVPSKATTSKEIETEAAKAGVIPTTTTRQVKGSSPQVGSGRVPMETIYQKATITKADLKTIYDNSPDFHKNPVLTFNKDRYLEFVGDKHKFKISPEALQINPEKLEIGDKIRVPEDALKAKGAPQQMRVYQGNEPLGFNPKNAENLDSGAVDAEVTKIVKRSEIAKNLSEKLGVPIRRGKFRAAGALGIFKPGQKVVRIKSGGLSTVFHEVAHFIDSNLAFSKAIDITERKALMEEYGYTYENQPKKQQQEAFAEFVRYKMTGQQSKIDRMAPKFDKVYEERMKTLPEIKEVLDTATADFKRWQAQPATAKILSQMSIGSQSKGALKDRALATMHDLYTAALDDLHPLSEYAALGKKFGPLPAAQNPYVLARNLRGWVGKADLFLNKGTFGKTFWKEEGGKTVMDYKGKGYSEIMKPIADKKQLDEFRVYIVAQRIVNDLAPRGIQTGISANDAKAALFELNKKYPHFEEVAKQRREFKDQLLEYAKENGLIGEEGLTKLKTLNKYHVPFYRVMEETTQKFLGKSKIAGNLASPIKRIKGSEREIIDPLESDVKDVYAIINAAERNNIGIAMANLSSRNFELGRLFEKVDKPMAPVKVNVEEVLTKALDGTDVTTDMIPEELQDLTVTLFKPVQDRGPNMLNVNFGDQQRVYQVDPDLFKSIQGLNLEDMGIIMKVLAIPAKVLRAGATLSPDFTVRNPLRDQFTAFVYSKYGFAPGVDLVRGMWQLFAKDQTTYDLWKAAGGEHSMFVSLDREVLQKSFKELVASKGEKTLNIVKNPLNFLRIVSELGEQGTRLGEMRNALASHADPIEAAFASREVTLDFARIGAKTRGINAIAAFWNANVQGTDAMIRHFKDRPFRTLWKVLAGITLPSVLLYLANRDDPRWKEIPQWQKDLFWIVMTKDHIWRIPKPFELGILFGSVPERVMEAIDTKNPEVFDQLMKSIAGGFTPGFMPTAIIPEIENITNYSFFLDRPIVPQGKEGLPPPEQYGNYTSETAKVIGEALNYSPAKIDNLVSGYTGGLGKYAVAGMDKVLEGTGISSPPPPPTPAFEDLPVIKAFLIRKPAGSGSESVNRLYNEYSRAQAEYTLVNKLANEGEKDKALTYIKKHPEVANAPILNATISTLSEIRKVSDEIRRSRDLTPEQKRSKLDQLDQLQTDLARKTLELIKK